MKILYYHRVFLYTSYKLNERLGFHIVYGEDELSKMGPDYESFQQSNPGDIVVSVHTLPSPAPEIESLVLTDPYFKGVHFFDSPKEFFTTAQKDLSLSSQDIGKWFLSKADKDPVSLHKLTYLAYADYLEKTGKKLFSDAIFAYPYGPVCEDLLQETKGLESGLQQAVWPDSNSSTAEMIASNRIERAENGFVIADFLRETLKKYNHLTACELVELTHRPESPWSRVFTGQKPWQIIPDDIIQKSHSVENL